MEKIRYLLILVNKMPVGGSALLKTVVLDRLYPKGEPGKPYRSYVDSQTKIEVLEVGEQDFSNWMFVSMSAAMNFKSLWGRDPNFDKLRWQPFAGRIGKGVVIQE